MKIAILGAGAVGLGSAALLCSRGFEPTIWSKSGTGTAPMAAGSPLVAEDAVAGEFRPRVARTAGEAIEYAGVILVAAPAWGHRAIFDEIAAHAHAGATVIVSSHTSFGALYLSHKLAERGHDIPIAAFGTTVTTGRRTGPGRVRVTNLREKVDVAAVPAASGAEVHALCRELFGDRFVPRPDVIAIALSNLNPQNHMAATLLNFTRVERGEAWVNWELHTPGVASLIGTIDAERLAIARALGYEVRTVEQHWRLSFAATGGTLAEMAASIAARDRTAGPTTTDTRYVLEDAPFGLVPTALLGRLAGTPTPLHDAGIAMFSAIYGRDLRADNDLLPVLGLENMGIEQVLALAREGWPQRAEA